MVDFLAGLYKGHLHRKQQKRIKRQFGTKVCLKDDVLFTEDTILEGYNTVGKNCDISGSKIGLASYLGDNCKLYNCQIGRFCSISWNVEIMAGEHPVDYVSTHPIFYSNRDFVGLSFDVETDFQEQIYSQPPYYVTIGSDVLINCHAKLAAGICVGHGAIIKSGAVVVKDVPPYAIVGGVPAKVIGYRFSPEDIDFLLNSKWWEKDLEYIRAHAPLFNSIDKFKGM